MRFLRPEMAVWLLALPVAAAAWTLHVAYRRRHRRAWPAVTLSRRTSYGRDLALLLLAVTAIALLTGAMMRPQIRAEQVSPVFARRDLVLMLDRSVSMRAKDIEPSRAARAIDEIENFLRRKPASIDRVALVGFSGTSVVLSYPTADLDSLYFYLDWLRDDPSALYGTDMSAALDSALGVARRDRARRQAPVFVLISDGEDHGPQLDRTAAAVARAGIPVHTIGIGSYESVPMPVPVEGGEEAWLTDDAGRILRTEFNEATLRRIAGLTGGRYFRSVTGTELRAALDSIATGERRQAGTTTQVVYRDIYMFFLAAAVVAAAGLVILA